MAPAHVRGRRRAGGDRPGPDERRDGRPARARVPLLGAARRRQDDDGAPPRRRDQLQQLRPARRRRPAGRARRAWRSSRAARSTRSRSTAPRTARSTRRATSSRSCPTRPSRDRRKVFIIDEVHAISSAAFQALLKTLEEPPAHAVFILATTERHKIPATILSRCQRFDFRRLTDDEVADRLADIAGREGFAVVESASAAKKGGALRRARRARRARRRGDGQPARRALALRPGRRALRRQRDRGGRRGAPRRARPHGARRAPRVRPLGRPRRRPQGLRRAGGRGRRAARRRSTTSRRSSAAPCASRRTRTALAAAGLSEDGAERLARVRARRRRTQTLLRLLTLLSESDGTLRRSDVPALAFEVLLLRLAELPRLVG